MKTVVHLIYADGYSGLESLAVQMIKNLPPSWKGIYAAPAGIGLKCAAAEGVEVVECNTHSVSAVKELLKEMSPDAVHAHDPHMSLICALCGYPFISHLHCNCPWMKKLCKNSLALAFSAIRAKKVVCVSQSIVDEFIFSSLIKKKLTVLQNVVDIRRITEMAGDTTDKKYDLCFVGRLTPLKQPEKLLEVVSLMKERREGVHAVVVGDGECRKDLEMLSREMSLSSNVTFVGFQSNPWQYMAESRIGVLTSKSEGFGLAAVEAMILGLPFLAFPAGGLCDIVCDENGKLLSNAADMADEALLLLSDGEYYEKKSRGAKETVQRFTDMEAYMKNIVGIYNEL